MYTLSPTCVLVACVGDIRVSGFVINSETFVAGKELVDANAVLDANVFQNIGGSPGPFLGPLSLPGSINFAYFGRSLGTLLGTFPAQITAFDFMGMFTGHTVEVRNAATPSTGETTITQVGAGLYEVSGFFDIFAELSIDGGPFVPGPPRHTVLTAAVPEPGSLGLAAFGVLGLAAFAARRRRSA